jgi:dimeric dUTPase (all-alpha-NTP-PPase superfamily)
MMDRLEEMLKMQEALQTKYNGGERPGDMVGVARMNYVRTMVLATEDELHEALRETQWKPWSHHDGDRDNINRPAFLAEMIDAWHFYMNLLLVANITADEFFNEYLRKNGINHDREDNGYVSPTG